MRAVSDEAPAYKYLDASRFAHTAAATERGASRSPMTIDPHNPVVQLCTLGMHAEGEGRVHDAKSLFEQAWEKSADDYEACIASHYLARHQSTNEEKLHWNEVSLARAESAGIDRISGFMPSLLLNVGHSHELLGAKATAREFFERAEFFLHVLPEGPYTDAVRDGVARALARTAEGASTE